MDLDANALIASLFIGTLGVAMFVYGKKQGRWPHMLVGFLLVAFPYFVPSALIMCAIAAVLVAGLWLAVRYGV